MMKAQNHKPKKSFDPCFEVLINVAHCVVALYEESLELRTQTPRQRVLTISKEIQRFQLQADAFPRKDFLIFSNNQDCLYNVFFSHQLIYHRDDEPLLQEALILSGKLKCLAKLLAQEEREYAAFTNTDFSEEKENISLYELHQRPRGMSQEDYYRIMNGCIKKRGKCVNFEFESIRKRFVETVKDKHLYGDLVISNIQLLDEVFQNNKPLTATQLSDNLSKLTGLLPGSLPDEMDEFHGLFYRFDPRKSFYHALSPKEIQLAYEQIREGKLSPVPVCCLSLIRFKKWLTAISEGKIGLNDPPDSYFQLVVEKCYENNIGLSHRLMLCFKMSYPYGNFTKEQYKFILLNELTKCRKKLERFNFPEYFHILLTREDTLNHFIDQCWLDSYPEDHSCEMGQAIVLHEMIGFYIEKLSRLDPALVNPTLNIRQMKKDFKIILSIMVLNPEITERLWKAFSKFSRAEMGQKPFLFLVEDLKDVIEEIFREAMNNLIALLKTQPDKVIEAYAKKMLMELEELQLVTPKFGQGLDQYVTDLKRVSEMMLKCIIGQQSSPLENEETPYDEMQGQVIKEPVNKKISFGYKKSPGFLTPFILALNDAIDFLDERTSMDDYIRMVSSDDLDSITDKIYLGCKTNEFKYLLKHFKAFFKSFNPATIGKSGIFISNMGNLITAESLYNAESENLQTKIAIDNIFNQKQQKNT